MLYVGRLLIPCLLVIASLLGLDSSERRATLDAIVERDFQLLPPDLRIWFEQQKIPVNQYNKVVAKLNYAKVLKKITEASKLIKKPATYGLRPEHRKKNVHKGCIPYDETRTLRTLPGFYISASDVLTPEQEYIVGESPSSSTEDNFWHAIVEADVTTIVALVTPRGDAYWDTSRFPKTIQHWTIEKIEEVEEARSPFLVAHRVVRRVFRLTHNNGNKSRIVTHFQYENWPDHDAPESTLFHRLLALTEEAHPDGDSPIFVHCAAGYGRSGTFVAAHSLRKDIQNLPTKHGHTSINIAKRILEMRMQRKRLLGNHVQLSAVIEAVRDAIIQKEES